MTTYVERWTVHLTVDDDMLDARTPIPLAADRVLGPPCPYKATLTFCYRGKPVFVMRTGGQDPAIELAVLDGRNEINPLLALVTDANTRGGRSS
jgi:hypothetical protein